MNSCLPLTRWSGRVLGLTALLLGSVTAASAAVTLQGQIGLRPLTSSDVGDYKLPSSSEYSGGLSTIGVGQPAYLEAQVNVEVPLADITNVTWALTSQPVGSGAALTDSVLPAGLPVYEPADAELFQVAGQAQLRPDLRGQYTVSATIQTATYGTITVSRTLTAGVYMGVRYCMYCHSGSLVIQDMMSWTNTPHATMFTRSIDGKNGTYYSKNCIVCHTVGYDTNTNAVNNGFDDVMLATGWKFPSSMTNGNWAAVPADLKKLANIQCENCHGPGSEHAYSLGDTNRISVSWTAGNCAQCHDAKTHHIKTPEWKNSMHAVATRDPSGPGEEACVACHTGKGFVGRVTHSTVTNTVYEPIGCVACHDPHDASNPHQLRTPEAATLMNGTVVTNAGAGAICMYCHMARRNAATYVETTAGSSRFGPHHGPQADMFLGANAVTYGKAIPSSAHRDALADSCVTCHMQETAATDPAFLKAGGHTFSMSCTNNGTNVLMTAACAQCHGKINTFDLVREDFNGDGIIEGVQTEVKHLLDELALLLPPVGQPKSSLSINSSWTRPQLRAAYNYLFVQEDRSFGVHNAAFAVGLLRASIADVTPDANKDGLPDAWQIQYFGSVTNKNAAPNAAPAGDGIPNWLKYALGLNPMQKGIVVGNGMVWARGNRLVSGGNDTVQIFTAAEVTFNTEVGRTYQIEAISSLGGGWTPVGDPIVGTGQAVSYVTPTRADVQQFYRVSHTP